MKKLFLIIFALAMTLAVFADAYTIGTGQNTQSYIPFYGLYDYSWSKAIYTAAELTAAEVPTNTTITGISFFVGATPANYVSVDQRVYVRHTGDNEINTAYVANPQDDYTEVWVGDLTWNGSGWHNIMFTSTFTWNGTSNLEILWYNWDGAWQSGPNFHYTATTRNLACYNYADTNMPTTVGTPTLNRPNIRILDAIVSIPSPVSALLTPVNAAQNVAQPTQFSWSAPTTGGIPTGYKLYIHANNNDFSGVTPIDVTGTSHSVTLNYSTPYYWKVRATNSAGDSPDSDTWNFTTVEDPIAIPDYYVDFGTVTGDWPELYWTQRSGFYPNASSTATQWVQDDWLNVTSPANKAAKINVYGTSRNGWLITRPVNIPATGDYQMKFDLALMAWNSVSTPVTAGNQPDDKFMVLMADDALMTTNLTVLREWDNASKADVFDNINPAGETVIIPLNGISGVKYFAFYAESTISNGDLDLMIDNVYIRETPTTAVFELNPDDEVYDFGRQIINTTASKTFKVTNTGGAPLVFESVSVSGDYFDPEGGSFDDSDIPAGEDRNFTVEYKPTVEGNHEGELEFVLGRQTITVDLTGECFDPTVDVDQDGWAENFDSVTAPAIPEGWTILDANEDGKKWVTYGYSAHTPDNTMYLSYDYNHASDDYAISPPLSLTGGQTYKLEFYYKGSSYGEKLKVMLGSSPTVDAMDETIWDLAGFTNSTFEKAQEYFTPDNTGIYYLGWHGYSDANKLAIYFDTVNVYKALDYDLAATDISGDTFAFEGEEITHTVTVENRGYEDVNSYTVYLKNADNDTVLAQETITTVLESGASNQIPLEWEPQNLGEIQIYGEVSLNDDEDENHANDACAPITVKVYANDLMVESFEGTTFPPEGWMRTTSSISYWTSSTLYAVHGSRSMYAYTSTSLDYRISTPILQIGAGSTLDFYARATYTSQVLKIQQSTDRENWQQVGNDITFAEANTWYPISIPLDALGNGNFYLAFYAPTHTSTGSIYVDFVVAPKPANVAPGPVTLVSPADEAENVSARPTFSWNAPTTGGLADSYKVYVGTSQNFTQDDLMATVQTPNYTPTTDLAYETQYHWTVVACKGNLESTGNPVRSFTTKRNPTIDTFPFFEGFESGYTHNTHVAGDWDQLLGGTTTKYWTANNTLTNYNRRPRNGAWNAFLEYGSNATLVRPIELQAGLTYTIEFYARQDASSGASIQAKLGNAPSLAALTTNITSKIDLVNGDYQKIDGIFSVQTSGIYYIGIQGEATFTPWYISLDDITIDVAPDDPPLAPILTYPLAQQGLPKNGFDFEWERDPNGGYPDYYGLFIWEDGGEIGDIDPWEPEITSYNPVLDPDNPMQFEYEKRYYWAVGVYKDGEECAIGEGENGNNWFTIEKDPTITEDEFPWCVDFENVPTEGFPLTGWTVHNIDGAGTTWQSTTSYNHTPDGGYAAQHGYASGAQEGWMITPPIELPGNPAMLKFWQYNLYPGDYEYNGVWVTTGIPDPINGTWTELWNPATVTGNWVEEIVPLDVYANDTIHLAFVYEGTFAHTWVVDDICVQLQPTELLAPILDLPIVDAENLSKTGFDFRWHFDTEGLIPDSYKLYLSQNPANLLTDYVYTGLPDPIFNPAQADNNPVTFGYDEVWYWTVGAVKAGHDEEIATHRKFTIERDPTITEDDFPWCVDFEDVPDKGFPLPGWTVHNLDGASPTWDSTTAQNHTPGGTYSAWHNYGYNDPEDDGWLITPPITLPQGAWELKFWNYNTFPTYYEYNGVWITTGDPDPITGTWTEIWSPNFVEQQWIEESVPLSAYADNTIHLAFVYQGYNGHAWYVDDICISETFEHDVAVTGFVSPAGVIINGGSAVVEVMVENLGANTESFQLKLNDGANDYFEPVNLDVGASAIVPFENISIPDYTIATLTATAILSTDQNLDNNEIETVVLAMPVDVQAYADVAWDPVAQSAPGPGTFNLQSPGIITDLAPGNPFGDDFLSGADWIDGAWLGSEYDDYDDSPWWEIDHITGAGTLLGSCGENLQGIAWNANLDIVYGTDGSSLFTVDKNTGDTEFLGDLTWDGEPEDFVVGLAYDNTNDILYGVSLTWDAVFTIDPTTYEMEPLGWTTGYDLNYAQDMAFDQNTGLLYLSAYDVDLKGMLLLVNTFAPDEEAVKKL